MEWLHLDRAKGQCFDQKVNIFPKCYLTSVGVSLFHQCLPFGKSNDRTGV